MAKLNGLYAAALYELILEENKSEAVLEQAFVLRDALKDSDCRKVLTHPNIPNDEKRKFFLSAFAGFDGHLLSFICLTIDKNREMYIISALTSLIALLRKRLNITTAKVVTASAVTDKQTAELRAVLEEKLKKQVLLEPDTDPNVIGGVHIQTDSHFIDRTVKRRLAEMTSIMKERCGA
jgi:F-type H+-transporting ATPase subunit delta